MINYMITAGI